MADEAKILGPMPSQEWLAQKQRTVAAFEDRREETEHITDMKTIMSALIGGAQQAAADHVREPEPSRHKFDRNALLQRGLEERHLRSIYDKEPIPGVALTAVQDFLASDRIDLLLLLGGPGTHKTGAASWALTQRSGRLIMAADIFAGFDQADREALRDYRKCNLLVIDELGKEESGKYWAERFYTLMNHRYADCSKTIITGNMGMAKRLDPGDPPCFVERYDAALVDRIRETGRVVVIGGASMRKRS